jgi:hypothetical protein
MASGMTQSADLISSRGNGRIVPTTDSCTAASDVPVMGIATSPESRRLRSQPSHVA